MKSAFQGVGDRSGGGDAVRDAGTVIRRRRSDTEERASIVRSCAGGGMDIHQNDALCMAHRNDACRQHGGSFASSSREELRACRVLTRTTDQPPTLRHPATQDGARHASQDRKARLGRTIVLTAPRCRDLAFAAGCVCSLDDATGAFGGGIGRDRPRRRVCRAFPPDKVFSPNSSKPCNFRSWHQPWAIMMWRTAV
ncbi:hypothetical protein C8J36_10794 [Rhizobium sp. PP-F2F-G48]|nr:hypothetical protein C8J36_10794 [Rhizobium sp. PP-F2F-G48]